MKFNLDSVVLPKAPQESSHERYASVGIIERDLTTTWNLERNKGRERRACELSWGAFGRTTESRLNFT